MNTTTKASNNGDINETPVTAFIHSNNSDRIAPTNDILNKYEDSPAYFVLRDLLESRYRKNDASELRLIKANSTRWSNLFTITLGKTIVKTFEVKTGHIRLAEDGKGNYIMFDAGVHRVRNPFMKVAKKDVPLTKETIVHGRRSIVTIKQGYIGYAEDMGQPILLPPGLHEWESNTLHFIESIDVNNTLIRLGPYTVLTVDEGYAAITQNNGRQMVMAGGKTHLLNHRNWKFEKFMSEKIQTDDLQRIEATSADNVLMHTDATVVWRISDVMSAAKMSAETMRMDGKDVTSAVESDIKKLRNDVLKQATASLAAFIGAIRYSDSFHISAMSRKADTAIGQPVPDGQSIDIDFVDTTSAETGARESNHIFDAERLASAVHTANLITSTYGVTILSINIISATPADKCLQTALAKGAVAAAEAEQAEVAARGKAKAARIIAEGDADAERIRAEGARQAADLLASSEVAVALAKIDKTGRALGDKTTFFFGKEANELDQLLGNSSVVSVGM